MQQNPGKKEHILTKKDNGYDSSFAWLLHKMLGIRKKDHFKA